jgi:hypothetical protein
MILEMIEVVEAKLVHNPKSHMMIGQSVNTVVENSMNK